MHCRFLADLRWLPLSGLSNWMKCYTPDTSDIPHRQISLRAWQPWYKTPDGYRMVLPFKRVRGTMTVKAKTPPLLTGLSPVGGKTIVAQFDAACMSSDGGLLALREVEQRLAIGSRLAACIYDPRDPSRVVAKVAIIRQPPRRQLEHRVTA